MKKLINKFLYNLYGRVPRDGSLKPYLDNLRRKNEVETAHKITRLLMKKGLN